MNGDWVYLRSEPTLWTVGFYRTDGRWEPDSDHDSADEAAQRVRWLNGAADEHHDRMVRALLLCGDVHDGEDGSVGLVDPQALTHLLDGMDETERAQLSAMASRLSSEMRADRKARRGGRP